MKKKYVYVVSIIVALLVGTYLGLNNMMSQRTFAPEGLPDSYFELVDSVEGDNLQIYFYGDSLDFPESLNVQTITDFSEITITDDAVLIINASWQEKNIQTLNLNDIKVLINGGLPIIFSGYDNYEDLDRANIFTNDVHYPETASIFLLTENGPEEAFGTIMTDNHKIFGILHILKSM